MPTSRKIMLVDDDPAVRASLQFSLELQGFSVDAFASSEEALACVDWRSAACLVIEQRLAEGNGLSLLSRLRGLGTDAPVVILTTNPSRQLQRQVAAAGASLVEKPLLSDELIAALRHLTSSEDPTATVPPSERAA